MANMFLAGFAFGIAIHYFVNEEWAWGICNSVIGIFNLVMGFML